MSHLLSPALISSNLTYYIYFIGGLLIFMICTCIYMNNESHDFTAFRLMLRFIKNQEMHLKKVILKSKPVGISLIGKFTSLLCVVALSHAVQLNPYGLLFFVYSHPTAPLWQRRAMAHLYPRVLRPSVLPCCKAFEGHGTHTMVPKQTEAIVEELMSVSNCR